MQTTPEVFVSYRNVSLGWAVTLDQALRGSYGDDRVFRAGRSIRPGDFYERVILEAAARCRLMLVVVGPTWLAPASDGSRLIDREDDFVRREITAAFKAGAQVVPVLVDGAARLTGAQLPEEIAAFCDLQSEQLRGQAVDDDLARILKHLAGLVQPLPEPVRPGPPPDAVVSPEAPPVAVHETFTPRRPDVPSNHFVRLVEHLISIPEFANPSFRDELTSTLRPDISGVLARHARPRPEAVSLVKTCARFPGGLLELLEAVRLCAGDVPEVRGFHAAVSAVV